MLCALLTRVAGDLLCSRLHPDVLDPAGGNALLSLILAQQDHWQALVHQLVSMQPTPQGQETAGRAFAALLSTNGVTASLARPNRTRFRANLQALLQYVHGGGVQLPR